MATSPVRSQPQIVLLWGSQGPRHLLGPFDEIILLNMIDDSLKFRMPCSPSAQLLCSDDKCNDTVSALGSPLVDGMENSEHCTGSVFGACLGYSNNRPLSDSTDLTGLNQCNPELQTPDAQNLMSSPIPTSTGLVARGDKGFHHCDVPESPIGKPLQPSESIEDRSSPIKRSPLKSLVNSADPVLCTGPSRSSMQQREDENVDNTCLSNFSEAPDAALLARLKHHGSKHRPSITTPKKETDSIVNTSRKRLSPSCTISPTPRKVKAPRTLVDDNNTTLLIDFTQQFEEANQHIDLNSHMCSREPHSTVSSSTPRMSRATGMTPSRRTKSILNLLDFDLPPAPTPRSIPSITVREIEILKASYQSELSSLRASLNGRVAEVESLKRAVSDGERRAGEATERLQEEKLKTEHAEEEKSGWEKRCLEMENILNDVREEIVKSEAEKEDLLRQVDGLQAQAAKIERQSVGECVDVQGESPENRLIDERVQNLVAQQIDAKIEAVSRELHTVYKEKHERKVATLKKSYEARSEKKCLDLQTQIDDLQRQNEELIALKDASFSGTILNTLATVGPTDKAYQEELKATIARLEEEALTSKEQHRQLMHILQQERIEKGDLVAAVDEMLALQTDQAHNQKAAITAAEDFRKSLVGPSGVKPPTAIATSDRNISRGGALRGSASSSGAGKSKMLASIERMGRNVHGVT